MDIQVGDTLLLKKNHPCGGNEFLVLRIGMDFRVRCLSCGREFMRPRPVLEKAVKKVLRPPADPN